MCVGGGVSEFRRKTFLESEIKLFVIFSSRQLGSLIYACRYQGILLLFMYIYTSYLFIIWSWADIFKYFNLD